MELKYYTPFLFSFFQFSIIQFGNGFQLFRDDVIINSSELTVFILSPKIFNWKVDPEELNNQIEYSARISQSPDLPTWLHYTYDGSTSIGHLYGVPPKHLTSVDIDVIAKNRNQSNDVRQLIITFTIISQPRQKFVIEFKIDNMDARDFCNEKERQRLVNLFSQYLDWQRMDGSPVIPVYLMSATDLGESQFSLRPFEAEGVVIHLGSDRNFSAEMFKLQKEVSPLWKLRPCPRDLKRTSMEKYFRSHGILVDWCSFKLTFNPTSNAELQHSEESKDDGNQDTLTTEDLTDVFHFRSTIPEKSYGTGILLATIVPGAIGSLIAIILIGILWNDEDESSPVNGDTLFFEAAFRILAILFSFNNDNDNQDSVGLIKNPSIAEGTYQQYNAPGNDEDFYLLTGDGRQGQEEERRQERATTPLPPEYATATHPNGSPALTYAV